MIGRRLKPAGDDRCDLHMLALQCVDQISVNRNCPLAERFPALLSHSLRLNISVADALSDGNLHLRNRLSAVAEAELSQLLAITNLIHLAPSEPDYRHVRNSTNSVFSTAASYSFAFSHLPDDPFAPFIWRNFAPSRCQSFLWLAHHHKLNTNFRLRSRRANNSGCCHFCGAIEDTPHLFLHCPQAQSFWALLNVSSPSLTHY